MIKIEVTGNSIPEVADKLLAIGSSLRNSTGVWREATDAPHKLAERLSAQLQAAVAEAAPVKNTPAASKEEITSKPAENVENTPATSPEEITSATSEDEELEVVDLPIATLDIETDVRPLILSVVEKRGKPVMEELLSRFGVAKASQIEPALLPELVALMQEALAK